MFMKDIRDELLPYKIGGLLYFPAIKRDISSKLEAHAIPCLTSIAFCLEDSILDESLALAEKTLRETLREIRTKQIADLPLIFVRICSPEHLLRVHSFLAEEESILTGYILPKFDLTNSQKYIDFFRQVNTIREKPLCFMPILESAQIAYIGTRNQTLTTLKKQLDTVKDYVPNIRVGGNDFCNLFGLRRSVTQNIYQIGVVRSILEDILNVFSQEYVVSGPVWEYFDNHRSDKWKEGLEKELELDRLNGFIGKTAIHPSQLPSICNSLRVSKIDYEDALSLLQWEPEHLGVAKSTDGGRMNEKKCHENWAKKVLCLATVYGVKGEKDQNLV